MAAIVNEYCVFIEVRTLREETGFFMFETHINVRYGHKLKTTSASSVQYSTEQQESSVPTLVDGIKAWVGVRMTKQATKEDVEQRV